MTERESLTTDSEASHHRLARYGPLVIWALLIFIGSTSVLSASHTSVITRFFHWLFPHASEGTLRTIHFAVRKAGHFGEYAVLGLFAARAFRTSAHERLRQAWFWASFGFIVIYALSDEFHQSFVAVRTASIFDSMIDSAGGLAALIVRWILDRRPRRPESR